MRTLRGIGRKQACGLLHHGIDRATGPKLRHSVEVYRAVFKQLNIEQYDVGAILRLHFVRSTFQECLDTPATRYSAWGAVELSIIHSQKLPAHRLDKSSKVYSAQLLALPLPDGLHRLVESGNDLRSSICGLNLHDRLQDGIEC